MGDHPDLDAVLKEPQLLKLFGLLHRCLRPLAKLTECVRPVRVQPNETPAIASSVVAIVWNE